MDAQKVSMFIMSKGKYFPSEQLPYIKDQLERMTDDSYSMIYALELKDPTLMLILSIFLGELGVDRFLIGDFGIGIGKLLTCGGCGIWALVDLFLIMDATKKYNMEKFTMMSAMNAY